MGKVAKNAHASRNLHVGESIARLYASTSELFPLPKEKIKS